jgi:hypothetical protein
MTQEVFPEIQAAAEALEKRIALTEKEVEQMKEDIAARKKFLRSWRKALSAFAPSSQELLEKQNPFARIPQAQRSN